MLWTRESIVQALLDVGEAMTVTSWVSTNHRPTLLTIVKYFGSWNTAREAAGLTARLATVNLDHRHARAWSRADILRALRDAGPAVTVTQWRKEHRHPSLFTIIKNFGSWSAARKAVGFQKIRMKRWTDAQIIHQMQTTGNLSILEWIQIHQKPSVRTIITRFGSWNAAKEAAGFSPVIQRQRRKTI